MYEQKKNELYHSDIYLGTDFSDGLKHWKYVSKYKDKKGKWRYVYKGKTKIGRRTKELISTKITGDAYKQQKNEALNNIQKIYSENGEMPDGRDGGVWMPVVKNGKFVVKQTTNNKTRKINEEKNYSDNAYKNRSLKGITEGVMKDINKTVSKISSKISSSLSKNKVKSGENFIDQIKINEIKVNEIKVNEIKNKKIK